MKKLRDIITEAFSYEAIRKDKYNLEHQAKFGKHSLNIVHSYDTDRKVLGTNFTINGCYSPDLKTYNTLSPEQKVSVFTTVKHSTLEAISHFKPESFEWFTPNAAKMKIYNQFAKNHIQKKFGGRIEQVNHETGRLHFSEAVERTPKRAHKLLDYISKKYWKADSERDHYNLIPYASYNGKRFTYKHMTGRALDHDEFHKNGELKDVPIHKIKTDQKDVSVYGVHKKIGGEKHNDPDIPYIIHQKETDSYYLWDGNHRVNAAKLLRKPTIKAKVLSL